MHIALSGINAVDNPGPGVGVARALLQAFPDARILGLAYDALEPGIFLDWLIHESYLLPYPSGDSDSYLERLLALHDDHGMEVLIPNLDAELPLIVRYQHDLAASGVKLLVPTPAQFRLRSKDRLPALAAALDIAVPPTRVVLGAAEAAQAVADLGGVCFVKGCFYEAHKVVTPSAAALAADSLAADWGWPVLVQGAVEGQHLNVVGVGDGDGGHLGLVAMRKVWTTKAGKMWTGVTVRHEAMLDAAARFVAHTRWRGPFELECIVDEERIFLIEINPRFPAWTWMSAAVGVNLPERLVRHLHGESLDPAPDYEPGRLFVRYSTELVSTMETVQRFLADGERRTPALCC